MVVKDRVRLGGRSARIQAEVHKAVNELAVEMDRTQITVPMIAARAGVTPSTIYRRWGDLAQLLSDVAVQHLRPIAEPENTGSQASDLEAFVIQFMEEMSSKVGRALLCDIFANAADVGNAEECWRFTHRHLGTIADRAAVRGETPVDVGRVVDRVIAPILYHVLYQDRELSADYCRRLLADI